MDKSGNTLYKYSKFCISCLIFTTELCGCCIDDIDRMYKITPIELDEITEFYSDNESIDSFSSDGRD